MFFIHTEERYFKSKEMLLPVLFLFPISKRDTNSAKQLHESWAYFAVCLFALKTSTLSLNWKKKKKERKIDVVERRALKFGTLIIAEQKQVSA